MAAYRESVAIALAAGDRETAARAMRRLYYQLGLQGETAAARTTLDQAIELLESADDPGLTLAELYACRSESEMFAGRSQESLDWAESSPSAAPHRGRDAHGAAPARQRPLRAG